MKEFNSILNENYDLSRFPNKLQNVQSNMKEQDFQNVF